MNLFRSPELRQRAVAIAKGIGVEALKSSVAGAVEGFAAKGGLAGAVKGGLEGATSGARQGLRSEAVRGEMRGAASEVLSRAHEASIGFVDNRYADNPNTGTFAGNLLDAARGYAEGTLDTHLGPAGQPVSERTRVYRMSVPPAGPDMPR
jgi:hypothetical protein